MHRPSSSLFGGLRSSAPCPIHGPSSAWFSKAHGRGALRARMRRRWQSTLSAVQVRSLIPSMESMGLKEGDKVTVAMSGGVDSSVVLRMLTELPLELQVIFMRNWDPLLSESALPSTSSETMPLRQRGSSSSHSSLSSASASTSPSSSSHSGSASTASTSASAPPASLSPGTTGKQPDLRPCAWELDFSVVRAVCAHIGLSSSAVRLVDLSKEYWSEVFEPAIRMWEGGGTPNPDVGCNKEIKFGALMRHMTEGGMLATGHYAQILRPPLTPYPQLHRAIDRGKDQSYYLSSLTSSQLSRAICPLGGLTKSTTRALADFWGLPNKSREESMGICFVGERGRFGDFVSQYMPDPPEGWLIDPSGRRLKRHQGLWRYTIGQRAGLAGQSEAWYVAQKGVGESGEDVLVVPGHDNPYLYSGQVTTQSFHWIHGVPPALSSGSEEVGWMRAHAQVVSRQQAVPCSVRLLPESDGVQVILEHGIHGVARGQVLALASGSHMLGSGLVLETVSEGEIRKRASATLEQGQEQEREVDVEEKRLAFA